MTDLNRLFVDLARHATELDPHAIRTTIIATMDTGLRAASYDSIGGRSADPATHVERSLQRRHPGQFPKGDDDEVDETKGYWGGGRRGDPSGADLDALEHHVGRYVEAIHWLATRSHTGPFPSDWRSAVPGHRRLADMDAVDILDRSGQRPARHVHKAGDALHDIELIGRRHVARIPDDFDKLLSGDSVCLSHARIGDYVRPRHGDLVVCKTCRDLIAQIARPPEVHKDSEWWPTTDLLREHAEMERTGRRADYQRVRSEWIAGYPARRGA